MNKNTVTLVGVGIVAGGVGFIIGYKIAEKRLNEEFDARLEKETAGMREFYQVTKKPFPTPQAAAAALVPETTEGANIAYHKIIKQENYKPETAGVNTPVDIPDQPNVVLQNIFSKNERDPEIPYIISQEEFMENEPGWEQSTITYYRKDDVLVDEREDRLTEYEKIVGPVALTSFGLQSSDARTVHVRNEKLGMDFEIVLNDSSYAEEVLGLDGPVPELPSGRSRSD